MDPDEGSSTADAPPAMPRWVKVSLLVAAGLALLLLVVLVANGGIPGGHGPGRHASLGVDRIAIR